MLSPEIRRWLVHFSHSPLAGLFKPNKDELWLHWGLLHSPWQRLVVLRRKLLPSRLPGPVSAVHLKPDQLTFTVRLRRQWTYTQYLWQRAGHHLSSLVPTCVGTTVWIRDSLRNRSTHRRAYKS
jgi:hypothetical protein